MRGVNKMLFVGFIIGSLLLAPYAGYAYDDGDWQYWNTERIGVTIADIGSKKLDSISGNLEGEWRFGDEVSEFYYQHADIGIKFNKLFASWFNFGLYYRQVWEYAHRASSAGGNYWYTEYRPHFDPEVAFKISGWSIADRLRVELRYFDKDDSGKDDNWRLRNKITLKPPINWTAWGITPYIADEIFAEDQASGINRNRLYAGLEIKRLFGLKSLGGDIFLLWQAAERKSTWTDVYAFGTKLKLKF